MYKIVCFCGGGIRGLISATILENLANTYPGIITNTDLFAGTSTGSGIISSLIAGNSPSAIIQNYLTSQVKFFGLTQTNPAAPAYSITEAYGGQSALHGEKRLNQFTQSVLFTSFNVGSANTPWAPILYSNLPDSPTAEAQVADAVMSSCAMPGMLGSWKGNIDGAFVHHDPSLAAIAMAINYAHVSLSDIALICIGTGLMPNWIASDTSTWGAQQWQSGDGNPQNQTPALLVNGTDSPILNACLNGTSVSLVPELAGMMLQGNYAYLNPTLDRYIPENDVNSSDLTYLKEQAGNCDPEQMANAQRMLGAYWDPSS